MVAVGLTIAPGGSDGVAGGVGRRRGSVGALLGVAEEGLHGFAGVFDCFIVLAGGPYRQMYGRLGESSGLGTIIADLWLAGVVAWGPYRQMYGRLENLGVILGGGRGLRDAHLEVLGLGTVMRGLCAECLGCNGLTILVPFRP